jgi:hypothetical protein
MPEGIKARRHPHQRDRDGRPDGGTRLGDEAAASGPEDAMRLGDHPERRVHCGEPP